MAKRLSCLDGQNNLLVTLSRPDQKLIQPHLTPVMLPAGTVIETSDVPIETVVFPVSGVFSVLALKQDGPGIEAGLFGHEGMSGVSVVLGAGSTPHHTNTQIPGSALQIKAGTLHKLVRQSATLHHHVLRYVHTFMVQVGQTALCNKQAKLEERLARWLLMCHDRVQGDRIELTHEFLSVVLGARRAGVTVGVHILEGKGLIRANRGEIIIRDRDGLELEAQGFYGIPEREYERMIGKSPVMPSPNIKRATSRGFDSREV